MTKKRIQTVRLVQKIESDNSPVVVLICGMPGTRKSSTAVMLGGLLNFGVVIGTDEIYDVMMKYDRRPILREKSHKAWKIFGKLTEKNYNRGFLEQAKAIRLGVKTVLKKTITLGENIIIEGVHLVPSLYRNIKNAKIFHFLLITKSFKDHKKLLHSKFRRRHGRQVPWEDNKIQHLERTQAFLLSNAKKSSVVVIKSSNPEKNCQTIFRYLQKYI